MKLVMSLESFGVTTENVFQEVECATVFGIVMMDMMNNRIVVSLDLI